MWKNDSMHSLCLLHGEGLNNQVYTRPTQKVIYAIIRLSHPEYTVRISLLLQSVKITDCFIYISPLRLSELQRMCRVAPLYLILESILTINSLSILCFSLISLIDRRGFIQPDAPQLAPPTNGITMYGATQSQQSHMVRHRSPSCLQDDLTCSKCSVYFESTSAYYGAAKNKKTNPYCF